MMMKKWIALLTMTALLLTSFSFAVLATEEEETQTVGRIVIATEPGATSEHVGYYKNGEEQPAANMKWVDGGVRGKALSFNGTSDYLQIDGSLLNMSHMTFVTWINFRGAVDAAKPETARWQHMFTIEDGEDCYVTVSPNALDTELIQNGGQLNGIYMKYHSNDEQNEVNKHAFIPATSGKNRFVLPQNEWHHIAVTFNEMGAELYVDGVLHFDLTEVMISQMKPDSLTIGKGLWNDPFLNATVDDMMLIEKTLTVQEINALMQTGDMASLKNPAAATTAKDIYQPTTTVTVATTTGETTQPADKPFAPLGLPVWGFSVCMGVLALIILLAVIVNLYESYYRKTVGASPVQAENDDEPTMSIKEAAEQKRREEHERFLNEEQQEKEISDEINLGGKGGKGK